MTRYRSFRARFLSMVIVILGVYTGYTLMQSYQIMPAAALTQDIRMSSSIPSMYIGAKRQALVSVDLRRAHLLLGMHSEPEITIQPLLDAVLFVPKRFAYVRFDEKIST